MKKILWCVTLALMVSATAVGKEGKKEPAQVGPTTFGVSPPTFEFDATPGQDISATFKIENPLNVTSTYTMTPEGVVVVGSGTTTKPLSALPADHLARNLKFESATITVPPRSNKNVAFSIKVPASAKGTQYAGFIVSRLPMEATTVDRSTEYERHYGLGMQPALGITIKVTVAGASNYSYKLEGVRVTPGTSSRPPEVVATLRNTGGGELKINPLLILVDNAGKANIRMKSEGNVTLVPGGKLDVTFQSPGQNIATGSYKAILSIPDAKYQLAPSEIGVSIK